MTFFEDLRQWFHDYARSFYSAEPQLQYHVRLKEEHTLRVVQQAENLAAALALPERLALLTRVAALFHDVGRFKQYQTYGTFNDRLSIDHAALGADILLEKSILQPAGFSREEEQLIIQAIRCHNRRQLPPLQGEEMLLAGLVRDADKLDIYAMLVSKEEGMRIPCPPELQSAQEYSLSVVEDVLQERLVQPKDIKNTADMLLFRLSWIYDLNFSYSFTYILQAGYLEKMLAMLPADAVIRELRQYVLDFAARQTDKA